MTWFEGWGAQVLFHIVHLHIQIPNNNTPLPTFQIRLKHHDTITVSRLLHSGNLNSVHLFMAHSAYSQSTLKNSAFTKPMAFHWWQQNSSALLCFLSVLSVSETSKLIADLSSTRARCQATDSSSACLRWPWNAGFCLSLHAILMRIPSCISLPLHLTSVIWRLHLSSVISQYSPFTHFCHLHWPPCYLQKDEVCYSLGLYKYWDQFLVYPLTSFRSLLWYCLLKRFSLNISLFFSVSFFLFIAILSDIQIYMTQAWI